MPDTTTPRERRGIIAKNLLAQAPAPYRDAALRRAVLFFYTEDQRGFDRDMAYLTQAGLVEECALGDGAIHLGAWRLTARGYLVAEGSERDAGVDLMLPQSARG